MTELLQKAFAQIQKLPPEKQDAIATRLIAELKEENDLLNQLISTEAVVWSPQATSDSIQALSDLLTTAKTENNG